MRVLVPLLAACLGGAGCGSPPAPRPSARPAPVVHAPHARAEPIARPVAPPSTALPQALPRWGIPLRGGVIVTDRDDPTLLAGLPTHSIEASPERKSDYWSPCVRAFVQGQPAGARELLGEALSLYGTTCGPTRIEFRVPRAGRSAPTAQLALVGALERTTRELALRAVYRGEPIRAERITVIADGARWSSPRLDFERDADGEAATLPFTRTVAREVRRAIDARDALLRFESATDYEDVAISDELKQELRVMLDALDALATVTPP